ncbi:MAG: hypothetical protein C4545_05160 [Anaerolineaceae bacterium]|jgi:hypothetical protein|nr:MAG: hypothetical protein C4545_05160 [Anaerolineaceae bacterium]
MAVITLLTDFGEKDGYVGIMKGVIEGIAPGTRVIDLSHEIHPHNITEAAYLLGRSYPYFPSGTIHCCVVDPGVGTSRHGMAARFGDQFFVGPDNGLASVLLREQAQKEQPIQTVALTNAQYWLPQISRTFHGRDIFAPVAAHLALGVDLLDLGEELEQPVLLDLPEASRDQDEMSGEIIHVDAFGNLASNIRFPSFSSESVIHISIGDLSDIPLLQTYGEALPGQVVAVIDSFGFVAVCVVNGNASRELGVGIGEQIRVKFLSV